MANVTLHEKVRLVFLFVSLRHFHFFNCETETPKCFEFASSRCSSSEMFRRDLYKKIKK